MSHDSRLSLWQTTVMPMRRSLVASSTLASPSCSIVIDKVLTNSWLCHLVCKTADIQEGSAPASEPTKFRFLIKHLQHQ